MTGTDKNFVQTLKEATNGLLSEESIAAIETAFNETVEQRATVQVEAALLKQDADYAEKLKALLEAFDRDRTEKLQRVVKVIDTNNTHKLKKVVRAYQRSLNNEAASFKKSVVKTISNYLDVCLEEVIPQNLIEQAVKEKKAQNILNSLRQTLAVDTALMSESIKGAVIDGKRQINEAQTELEKVQQRAKTLEEKLARAQAELILTEKTATLSAKKRDYVKRVLSGKDAKFIAENIDYTIALFDKTEREQVDFLKEQALEGAVGVDDVPTDTTVVTEQAKQPAKTPLMPYMDELSKY